jgi:hypothetical protein
LKPKLFYSNIIEPKLYELNDFEQFLRSNWRDYGGFCHVKRLSLNRLVTKETLTRLQYHLNLKQIEYFRFNSLGGNNDGFVDLLKEMVNLSTLHIEHNKILDLFNEVSNPMLNIQRLILFGNKLKKWKKIYSRICFLFPRLTHLESIYPNRRILRYLIKKLHFLEELNFRLEFDSHVPNHHWIASKTRLGSDSFLSEIFNFNRSERIFLIWLDPNQLNLVTVV